MKKYGLQLRVPPQQKKINPTKPSIRTPVGIFDDDDDDVEREILRQANKNRSIKDVEEQHKKALEEDPSIFDYDGAYDGMKEKEVRPRAEERQERKPKYIQKLMEKAKEREREHEIVFERKLAKERSQEDHLYADKDKFVTGAYKKKLAEQAKWMEEERRRQLREDKDDVTKKSDMTDFYFNLSKNVAFGSDEANTKKPKKQVEETTTGTSVGKTLGTKALSPSPVKERDHGSASPILKGVPADSKPDTTAKSSVQQKNIATTLAQHNEPATEQPSADQEKRDHHKRSEDQVTAARERFLARKRAKENR